MTSGIDAWLAGNKTSERHNLSESLTELQNNRDAENSLHSRFLITSPQTVELFVNLARAVLAKSTFEKHIRRACELADWLDVYTSQRFRHSLAGSMMSTESPPPRNLPAQLRFNWNGDQIA